MPEELTRLLFLVTDGITWGFIVALIALGLALIFGVMGIINMAHGDLFMIGAVLAAVLGVRLGSFWPALLVAPLVVGAFSAPLEGWVLRPFEGKPLVTMVGTVGLSFIIQQIALITFGGTPVRVPDPIGFTVNLFGMPFPGYRLVAAGAGILLMLGLWLLLYCTNFGIYVRATMENPVIAEAMGINTGLIRQITFGLGAALAAAGGVLAAPIHQVFFLMGEGVLLFSFIVVIVGGLGSLQGAFIAALILSGLEGVLAAAFDPVEARALVLLFMALVLAIRPRGLFG